MAGANPADTQGSAGEPVELRRLRWRARRGLLENDLLIGRFLDRHGRTLDAAQNRALLKLLELPDTELLDLLLARTEPVPPLDGADLRALLQVLRAV
jgi:antitoxin CptB